MLVYKKPLNTVRNDKSVFNKLQKFVFGSVFGFGIIQILFTPLCYQAYFYSRCIVVARSNPTHGELYSIQHYVIKFVSDL